MDRHESEPAVRDRTIDSAPTRSQRRQLVVVGGGPAGLAATVAARKLGMQVMLVDDQPTLGGRSYGARSSAGAELIRAVERSGAEILRNAVVWGAWGSTLAIRTDAGSLLIEAERIILATGAYDRPVAFPGWTLPGVITVGAARTLVKIQRVSPGSRVLMMGSGPSLLAAAAELHAHGVNVVGVVEAARRPGAGPLASILRALPGNVSFLREVLAHLAYLRRHRIPLLYSHMVVRAEGGEAVERVICARVDGDWRPLKGRDMSFDVDTLCVGYGLYPSSELTLHLGCEHRYDEGLGGHIPVRDEWARTTIPFVFSIGDGAGVRGTQAAIAEAQIAVIGAAMDLGLMSYDVAGSRARPLRRHLSRVTRFQDTLRRLYCPGPGIYELADPKTVICRCEDVTLGDFEAVGLHDGADMIDLKTRTRATMGPCQGRNCARQVSALHAKACGIALGSIRPFTVQAPVRPVLLGDLMEEQPPLEPTEDIR